MSTKEELLKFVEELPNDSTLDDIEYYIYVRQKIERSRESIRNGKYFTQEQVEQEMNEWKEKSFGRLNH